MSSRKKAFVAAAAAAPATQAEIRERFGDAIDSNLCRVCLLELAFEDVEQPSQYGSAPQRHAACVELVLPESEFRRRVALALTKIHSQQKHQEQLLGRLMMASEKLIEHAATQQRTIDDLVAKSRSPVKEEEEPLAKRSRVRPE